MKKERRNKTKLKFNFNKSLFTYQNTIRNANNHKERKKYFKFIVASGSVPLLGWRDRGINLNKFSKEKQYIR